MKKHFLPMLVFSALLMGGCQKESHIPKDDRNSIPVQEEMMEITLDNLLRDGYVVSNFTGEPIMSANELMGAQGDPILLNDPEDYIGTWNLVWMDGQDMTFFGDEFMKINLHGSDITGRLAFNIIKGNYSIDNMGMMVIRGLYRTYMWSDKQDLEDRFLQVLVSYGNLGNTLFIVNPTTMHIYENNRLVVKMEKVG